MQAHNNTAFIQPGLFYSGCHSQESFLIISMIYFEKYMKVIAHIYVPHIQ
jgi:hypothetical protein